MAPDIPPDTPSAGYHRIHQEIAETPLAVEQTFQAAGAAAKTLLERLDTGSLRAVAGIGCGSSHFAALTLRYAVQALCGVPVYVCPSLDFAAYGADLVGEGWLVVAFSQSGETHETVEAARLAAGRGARVAAVTNVPDSRLARLAHGVVPLRAGEERTAGTKTVVAQGIAACALALALSERGGRAGAQRCRNGLRAAAAAVRGLIGLEAEVARIAGELARCDHLFVVGAGPMYALALQAATSLKEIAKVHAEGFEASEFRHGPLEYVQPGHTVVVLAHSDSPLLDQVTWAARLARRAGARVMVVHDGPQRVGPGVLEVADLQLEAPHLPELVASVVWLTLFHVLGYHMALHKGHDPDHLRNIVKTWTSSGP